MYVLSRGERRMQIVKMLQDKQSVRVSNLAAHFNVSEMTIRRDLNFLAQEYNISRGHGGAFINNDQVVRVVTTEESRIQHLEAKRKIAKRAAGMIRTGQMIFIDSGSSTRLIMDYIPKSMRAVIVTNNLKIAERALDDYQSLEAIVLGGALLQSTYGSYGQYTEDQLSHYKIDIAFLGAVSIGNDGLLYDGFTPEARLKNIIFSVANEICVLADSSKFNMYDLHSFGRLSEVSKIITDDGIDEKGIKLLQRYVNTELVVAS